MSTGLSFGNRARISSIVLYFAMQRAADDEARQDRGLLRSSETNADDSDNEKAKQSKHRGAAVKVFFILFERVKGK